MDKCLLSENGEKQSQLLKLLMDWPPTCHVLLLVGGSSYRKTPHFETRGGI